MFKLCGFDDHPEAIYNMDETGMPLESHPPKIVDEKGQKKVRYQTSGQKQQITIIGCGSVTEHVIPPSSYLPLNRSTICGQEMKYLGRILQLVTMDG